MSTFKMVIDGLSKAYESLIPGDETARRVSKRYMEMYGIRPEGRNTDR